MSGHSKWAGIKHKKAINDAERGNIFTKLANNITVAAKQAGGDPALNASLRLAMDKARAANMPKDNVERALKRGTGELDGTVVEELLYEGFGPGGVAILVEALSDNRNRTNADIRMIFNKNGGRMAEGGGVAYQFSQKGVIRFDLLLNQVDLFTEIVLESGAEDYIIGDGFSIVYLESSHIHQVSDFFEKAGFIAISAKIEYVANLPIEVEEENLDKISHFLEILEENEDVTNIYTNLAE